MNVKIGFFEVSWQTNYSLSKNDDNQKLLRNQSITKMEKLFNTKKRDFSGKMGTQIVTYNIHQKS